MRIAITGSNGFIGNELVHHFLSTGNEVLLLQRKEPDVLTKGTVYQPYDLNDPANTPNLSQVDALIHTAFIPFSKKNNSSKANIEGTLALYKTCLAKGVYFIFLSSMSSHQNALSEYGKHKFELEKLLDKSKCLILKLGLVIGEKGLFSRIRSLVQKSPFAFVIGGGRQPVQPVYIGDVASVIKKCIAARITGSYLLATPQVYTMRELFMLIGKAAGRKPFFIPVPYATADVAIRTITWLHLPFPVSGENLMGLKQLRSFDTQADLDRLGVKLKGLEESIEELI
jgi:nucleoside-diphosphate-sugar epimerase